MDHNYNYQIEFEWIPTASTTINSPVLFHLDYHDQKISIANTRDYLQSI